MVPPEECAVAEDCAVVTTGECCGPTREVCCCEQGGVLWSRQRSAEVEAFGTELSRSRDESNGVKVMG